MNHYLFIQTIYLQCTNIYTYILWNDDLYCIYILYLSNLLVIQKDIINELIPQTEDFLITNKLRYTINEKIILRISCSFVATISPN